LILCVWQDVGDVSCLFQYNADLCWTTLWIGENHAWLQTSAAK